MGCDCCKKAYAVDYERCQQDMERILRNRKPTSSKRYIAPCGESFAFGAKITMPKKKKRKNRRQNYEKSKKENNQ